MCCLLFLSVVSILLVGWFGCLGFVRIMCVFLCLQELLWVFSILYVLTFTFYNCCVFRPVGFPSSVSLLIVGQSAGFVLWFLSFSFPVYMSVVILLHWDFCNLSIALVISFPAATLNSEDMGLANSSNSRPGSFKNIVNVILETWLCLIYLCLSSSWSLENLAAQTQILRETSSHQRRWGPRCLPREQQRRQWWPWGWW